MDFTKEIIKALSWKEPYGTLMLYGKIETRTWNTNYRGLILLCASRKEYTCNQVSNISNERQCHMIDSIMCQRENYSWKKYCAKAFAIGKLIDCRPMKPEDEEKAFVKYYPDLYSWVFEWVKPIQPFDWKGSLGMRNLTQEEKSKIILL